MRKQRFSTCLSFLHMLMSKGSHFSTEKNVFLSNTTHWNWLLCFDVRDLMAASLFTLSLSCWRLQVSEFHLSREQSEGTVQVCCYRHISSPDSPLRRNTESRHPTTRSELGPGTQQATATTKQRNRNSVRRHCVSSSHRPAGCTLEASDERISGGDKSWYSSN